MKIINLWPSALARAGASLLLLVLFAFPAPAPVAQEEERLDTPINVTTDPGSDARIKRRLGNIYSNLNGLQDIEVVVDEGIVTLRGEISERADEDRALELAARTADVVSVQNELVYNRDVGNKLQAIWQDLAKKGMDLLQFLPVLLVALLVFIAFWFFARWLTRERGYLAGWAPNVFIGDLIRQIIRVAVTLVGLIIALEIADATSVIGSVLGALGLAGLALGFAIRDTVENYIASILLSLRQPFSPDDHVVIDGQEGLVLRLTSRATLLMSFDGNHIRIPNAIVYKGVIVNYTRNPNRRFSFELGVGTDVNLLDALQLARKTVQESPGVLASPAASVQIHSLGDSNVLLRFYAWIDQTQSDYSAVRSETIRRVKAAFQQADYDMPEPIYRLRIGDQNALSDEFGGDGASQGVLTEEPFAESPEPVEHSPEAGESPEAAARSQLRADERSEAGDDNLLREDAPKE
jgi:small-conductance mechanosensitive channel